MARLLAGNNIIGSLPTECSVEPVLVRIGTAPGNLVDQRRGHRVHRFELLIIVDPWSGLKSDLGMVGIHAIVHGTALQGGISWLKFDPDWALLRIFLVTLSTYGVLL